MNNNILLSLAISLIPSLTIGFVALLIIYKIYIKLRSRFNVNVNCWFCNQNTKVPYLEANSWTCPSCEQYNGFDKNGDYNREIYEQLDCSRGDSERFNVSHPAAEVKSLPQNGFCDECNEAQRLKVEKLSQFEPKKESCWDKEFKLYKAKLEDQYRLCSTCDRHLNKVLREKKKMVLGSKFLDFIIKGAETIKQPQLNQIQHAHQQKRKEKLRTLIIIISLINLFCLINSVPSLSKEHYVKLLGEFLGYKLFLISSHIIAMAKVVGFYMAPIRNHAIVKKFLLFSRTVFMMTMYSMGLKVTHFNFSTLCISLCPFASLTLAFFHNVADGFRLTRFTALMVIWSIIAGGLIEEFWTALTPQMLMFITSFLTFIMAHNSKPEPSPKLYGTASNSFHKIYSEDYISDDDTVSMLSQQINESCLSMHNTHSNKSPSLIKDKTSSRLARSNLSSSSLSLHQLKRTQLSPNSSFRNYHSEKSHGVRATFSVPMASPMSGCPSFCPSNLDMNRSQSAIPSAFGINTSVANSTFLNNSFTENNNSQYTHNTRENDSSFYTAANNSFSNPMFLKNNQTFVAPKVHSGIQSPFAISSSDVYNRQNTYRNLLSPTRFSANNMSSANTSWLSGGYFNQRQPMAEIPCRGLIIPAMQTQSMHECVSRSSSHSSGFESQTGKHTANISRENSMCPDFNSDCQKRTFISDTANRFHPIDSPSLRTLSPRPLESTGVWKQFAFHYRSNNKNFTGNCTDSFNLRKIHEELPSIQRADLLQQWKEGQIIS